MRTVLCLLPVQCVAEEGKGMSTAEVRQGDVMEELARMESGSVHCVVTSIPYYGLRDYGTGRWEGGDADCVHVVGNQVADQKAKGAITAGVRPGCDASVCRKCGAHRIDQQLGLEPTLPEYLAKMVAVFREVRRVLRDDGTPCLRCYPGRGVPPSFGVG